MYLELAAVLEHDLVELKGISKDDTSICSSQEFEDLHSAYMDIGKEAAPSFHERLVHNLQRSCGPLPHWPFPFLESVSWEAEDINLQVSPSLKHVRLNESSESGQ